MKKRMMMVLAAMLALLLTAGCGSTKEETKSVDLTEFYNGLAEEYEWDENYMASIEGDLLESYYPGLGDISTKQFIAMTPQMSDVVNELVFLEAETEEDAEKAAEILQKRIDDQAAGGAWYPESMEAWGRGQVIQEGTYVAMIASAEHQEEIADAFEGLFA